MLRTFLTEHRIGREPGEPSTVVALLLGAAACAHLAGFSVGSASPIPAVPDLVAIALRSGGEWEIPNSFVPQGDWRTTWTDEEHAAAVEDVRSAIGRGDVYQANVVGHRCAGHDADPAGLAWAAASIPSRYGAVIAGEGWAVGSASPEQLVRVEGARITTVPIKGTLPVASGSADDLRASVKDRAEHVMIVDLERNDLSRLAAGSSVAVESLYEVGPWAGLWHASSTVSATLRPDLDLVDVLIALAPGGSVTGAPKRAAWELLAGLEPVGRGPAMGALGLLWPGGMDLGLTIRTVAADAGSVHLWAGGGITWSSDPAAEVREAHAKAEPVIAALAANPPEPTNSFRP
ncbi:MAG TPA: chorismate-binding protein [Mycobacteriales bacterium]|nr:chorismate-binding protein [Mycobacteriales bacterium]